MDFSPDGSRIAATTKWDYTARVWDVMTGRLLTAPIVHHEPIADVRWSPDGRFVLTQTGRDALSSVGLSGTHLWDAATGQAVAPPLRHSDPIHIQTDANFDPDTRRIATVSRDSTTRVWTIGRDEHAVEDLQLLAELLSSRKLDAAGQISPVSAEEKQAAWNYLIAKNPEWFDVTARQVIPWQHREAIASMKAGHWREALAYLDRLVEVLPEENVGLYLRRANCAIQLADWNAAAAEYQTLLRSGYGSNFAIFYQAALVLVASERIDDYRELCQRMLAEVANSAEPIETHFTAWTCALAPEGLDDYEPAITLARQSLEQASNNQQYLDGLGRILLRAGRYDEAKDTLEQALEAPGSENTSTSYIRYFLAMTEQHLGNIDAAHQHLEAANLSADEELASDPIWNRELTIQLLRAEAEKLIESAQDEGNEQPPPLQPEEQNKKLNPDR